MQYQANTVRYAGFGRRFTAMLFDAALLAPLSLALYGLGRRFGLDERWGFDWPDLVVNDLLPALLTIFFWSVWAATPGKWLWDCEVLDATTGRPPGPARALIRYLAYWVSLLPLGLGFIWILWDKRKQGFHDKLARTIVVRTPPGQARDDEAHKPLAQLVEEAS